MRSAGGHRCSAATARRRSRPRRAPTAGDRRATTGTAQSSVTTRPAPTSPVSWLLAPDCSATAVREPLVDTANPCRNPGREVRGAEADHLLVRVDVLTAPGRERRRRRDRVGQRHERDPDRRDDQRPRRRGTTSTGTVGVGNPLGSVPTVAMWSESPSTAETTVAPTTATSTAGIWLVTRGSSEQDDEHRRPPR